MADPRELDLGGVADDDVITGAHVERAEAVDEELCGEKRRSKLNEYSEYSHTRVLWNPLTHTTSVRKQKNSVVDESKEQRPALIADPQTYYII